MTEVEAFTLGVARFCKEASIDSEDRRALVSLLLMPGTDAATVVEGISKEATNGAEQGMLQQWFRANPAVQQQYNTWRGTQGGGEGGEAEEWNSPEAIARRDQAYAKGNVAAATGGAGAAGGGAAAAADIAGAAGAGAGAAVPGVGDPSKMPTPAEAAAERAGTLSEAGKGMTHLSDVGVSVADAIKQHAAVRTMTGQRRSLRRLTAGLGIDISPRRLAGMNPEQLKTMGANMSPEAMNALTTAHSMARRTVLPRAARNAPAAGAAVQPPVAPEAAAEGGGWKWTGSSPPTEVQNKMLTRGAAEMGEPASVPTSTPGRPPTPAPTPAPAEAAAVGTASPGMGGSTGPTLARHGIGSTTSLGLPGGLSGPEYAKQQRSKAG